MSKYPPVTPKTFLDRLTEMRGRPQQGMVQALITATIFDDDESETVYMAREDAENWSHNEFVFVIPSNCLSRESVIARGWWAETKMFDLPLILED
jgi:hypothetical protein